jgi:hypothetical protein
MDTIRVEILDDGSIKATIDGQVSAGNHRNADEALAMLANLMGGAVDIDTARHTHTHNTQAEQTRQGG